MNERFKLAGFTAVGMLILASVMTGLSASLLDIASEFAIAPSRAGILYTLHFSGFLGLILVSLAVHGLPARLRLVVFAAWLYAVALFLAGASSGFLFLAVALVFAGGAGGVVEAHTATLMVMTTKDESEAGRLISLTQAFFAVGALLTPVYLAMGSAVAASWRSLFLILGGVGVVGALIGVTMRARRFQFAHTEAGTFRWKPLVKVSIAIACYVGAEVTIFGWAPTVMELYHGIPASRARLAPTLFWIGMLGGRLVIASLTRRHTAERLLRVSAILGVAAAVMLVVVTPEPLLWLAVALSSLACAGIWPLIVATSGETGHETGTTIIVAAGGLGAAVFPYLAGLISEVLPGHFILLMAAPLLLAVFFLSRSSGRPA